MHHGDVMNLVDIPAANSDVAINKYAEFITISGIEFIYDSITRTL
jgi:hypothetical protein